MFNNPRYITRGIASDLSPIFCAILWDCIDQMPAEKDYLQVFKVSTQHSQTVFTHSQEQPPYSKTYRFTIDFGFTGTIFVIDDGDHSTMLLAEEY